MIKHFQGCPEISCQTWTMQMQHLQLCKATKSTLQTSLAFQGTPNARNLLHNIPNLQSALSNFQSKLLAALEAHRHDGRLCRIPRQLRHLDIDVGWAARWHCGRCAQQREKEPTGPRGCCEGVEGCAEAGNCADWDWHLGGWPCRSWRGSWVRADW